jgi:hypothetical protein
LPSPTLQSARDLNVLCRPKRSKAFLLSYTFKWPLKKTESFCPCSRALNRSGKGLRPLLILHIHISTSTSSGQRNCASWMYRAQKLVTLRPQPGGGNTKSIRDMWWYWERKKPCEIPWVTLNCTPLIYWCNESRSNLPRHNSQHSSLHAVYVSSREMRHDPKRTKAVPCRY